MEVEFDYLIRGTDDVVRHCPYTLRQIEESTKLNDMDQSRIIARRRWTGRKDKHGVEIYEGDIVHAAGGGMRTFVAEVEIVRGCYGFWSADRQVFWTWLSPNEAGSMNVEVIGNIYDNPDLLKAGDPDEQ
jgi:uncharacterized phage protein (TIGR01671 family)